MAKYKQQEKDWSCGSVALLNILIHFKIANVTEKTVRKACNTTKNNGTDENGLMQGIAYYGLENKEWESISPQVFKNKTTKALKSGRVLIINSDAQRHWVVVLEYNNKKVRLIDSMFKEVNKSIDQWLTLKQLSDMCFCYDRKRDKKTFYAIEVWMKA